MNNIKVRFAPSPTGFMHIGNTRTALFNWLLAAKLGGKFMLRIDDTDRLRSKAEYEDAIRDALEWLGLSWSEEARQSARVERYNEVTEKLKREGRIYACYETPEELTFMRKRLLGKGLPPIYDRSALRLTEEQVKRYQAEGRQPHYRFKLLDGDIVWHDMVRGECRYSEKNLSDPVVIRADGTFLYHLPSVIDDVDFGITHIVRGEDHVTNTAAQIQMFEAVGGKVPEFAHLPLLTGKEGKLSKRLGSLGVRDIRRDGIEAMALCSFLARLGTSEPIEPFYDLFSLAKTLDLSKIGRAQPRFDEEELKHLREKYGMPEGRLYLAYCGGQLAGCIGLRKIDDVRCEMKRLYVRPEFRGKCIGSMLIQKIIEDAKEIGYQHMLLDTLPFLESAVHMYKKWGFYEIESYNDSPMETSIYMRLDL